MTQHYAARNTIRFSHEQSAGKKPISAKTVTGVVAATAASLVVGFGAGNAHRANTDHDRLVAAGQPCADISPQPGEALESIIGRIKRDHGNPGGDISIQRADGVTRTLANTPDLLVPNRYPQETDSITVAHVGALACDAVGGTQVLREVPNPVK